MKRVRTPLAAGAVALALVVWAWVGPSPQLARRVTITFVAAVLLALTLLVWAFFLAGLSRRARLGLATLLLLVAGAVATGFELRGFTGDLVPIVTWRFGARGRASALESTSPADAAGDLAAEHLDWPRFLGPGRDGRLPRVRLARDWGAHPPRPVWRRPVGSGWSGFSVLGAAAVTQEQRDGQELVVCYDLATGAERWARASGPGYESALAGPGPRATPSLVRTTRADGGASALVVAFSATGVLTCFELEGGGPRWSVAVQDDLNAREPTWGYAGSPLVHAGGVVVDAGGRDGGALACYDLELGTRRWAAGADGASYATPMLVTLAGREQLLRFGKHQLAGHDPRQGHVLWSIPREEQAEHVAQPVILDGDSFAVSVGYGVGTSRYRLVAGEDGRLEPELVWRSRALKAKFANFVLHAGHLYGLDDGTLTCVDASTGKRVWKDGRYGHGQLLVAGDLLLLTAEDGTLALVEASPAGHVELARVPLLEGKTWNSPAFAAPYLLVRNDAWAACFELALAD